MARIRVLCMFDGGAETIEAEGGTNAEAYERLVHAAAEMRLTVGVTADDRPGLIARPAADRQPANRSADPRPPPDAT